ncbi:unnamed protein product, partial [Mesorhabditis belari]|uniref:Uncharacterized protein n=1 Tax=Mesorhabditis belari TaxID=2138241 RepID=A0AAF3FIG4_9BILA
MPSSRVWLWHPNKPAPSTSVQEKNYRCCCYLFPSPSGFPIYNYILLAIELGALSLSLLTTITPKAAPIPPQTWFNMIIWASMTVIGIVASRTLRPFYMQIYLILTTILFVLGFFGAGLLLIVSLIIISVPKDQYTREFERAITSGFANDQHELVGTIFMLIVCMLVVVWQAQLTYSFYFYVRDRQLEIEARQGENQQNRVLVAQRIAMKDPEKQEMLPPPPYDTL